MIGTTNGEPLAQLLAWMREMGADTAVADRPTDWLARGEGPLGGGEAARVATARSTVPSEGRDRIVPPPARSLPVAAARPLSGGVRPAGGPTAAERIDTAARASARRAQSLEELASQLAQFDGCALKPTAKNLCFYRGAARARLMIIGEAPGRDEDLEGRPFVGRAGRLLDAMLAAIGLAEADVHITNIVYWRPPGNRTPTPHEAEACRPFLERQIELVDPEVLLLLGGAAAKHMLGVEEGIMRLRGKWRQLEIASRQRRVMATLHPAYLLRTPAAKRQAWRDLLAVETALAG